MKPAVPIAWRRRQQAGITIINQSRGAIAIDLAHDGPIARVLKQRHRDRPVERPPQVCPECGGALMEATWLAGPQTWCEKCVKRDAPAATRDDAWSDWVTLPEPEPVPPVAGVDCAGTDGRLVMSDIHGHVLSHAEIRERFPMFEVTFESVGAGYFPPDPAKPPSRVFTKSEICEHFNVPSLDVLMDAVRNLVEGRR